MVQLATIRAVNSESAKANPVTAVFTGGTSGIGEFTIRALVNHYKDSEKHLKIFIVGRNASSANRIINDCLNVSSRCQVQFVQTSDLSLLKNVDECCKTLSGLLNDGSDNEMPGSRIDLLFMSHSDTIHFGSRRETTEGLDKTMSLLYYSRIRFITNLLPLLRASDHPAHIISVYAGGLEKGLPSFHPEDLSLRDPNHYGLIAYRTHVSVMKTFLFERLAKENEGHLSLVHVFPGLVITPAFDSRELPVWFKVVWAVVSPVLKYFVAISNEEIGERMLFLSSERFAAKGNVIVGETEANRTLDLALGTDGVTGGGAYSVNQASDTNDLGKVYASLREKDFGQTVWNHTQEVFAAADRGEKFNG